VLVGSGEKRFLESLIEPVIPYPALLLRCSEDRILVVADLHIGWEASFWEHGIHIPSQTPKLIEKLAQVVHVALPTQLVILGDVKHAVARVKPEEWRDVPQFFEEALKLVPEIKVVPGNHDGNLAPLTPRNVEILPASGTTLTEDVSLVHGHAWPSPRLLSCSTMVMGHVHPVIGFSDALGFRTFRQVWVKAECDGKILAKTLLKHLKIRTKRKLEIEYEERFKTRPKTSRCIIMPTFNDFIGGQSINRGGRWSKSTSKGDYIGPILRSQSVNIEEAEVHMLDGTFLGKISQLKAFA